MAHVVDDQIEERTSFVIAELRRVALTIDQLWGGALEAGLATEIPLREASQAVHRAVITLSSERVVESPARMFTVEWE
jgi:hypothetical protein